MIARTAEALTDRWDTHRNSSWGWPQFLSAIKIRGLRGWRGESVEFRYPVVAVAGVNGAGKSTVLKAAAAAYHAPEAGATSSYSADDFFPNTPWETVENVELTYTVRRGDTTDVYSLRKPTKRWRGADKRRQRSVYFLDIARIQPANTQIGYGRKAQEVISRGTTEDLGQRELRTLNSSLGRSYSLARLERSKNKQIGIVTRGGVEYSNFHQGAGKDSILDLVSLLYGVPEHSLVIIDEIEASLHPVAQRGLITELLSLAKDRKLQFILSTHSPYVLEQLPPIARVFISVDRLGSRDILYGITTDFALNMMDNENHFELDIYCEDDSAEYIIESMLAAEFPNSLKRVRIVGVGAASVVTAVATMADKLPRRSLCVVDFDQPENKKYIRLPGGSKSPERELFESLNDDQWRLVSERIARPTGEVLDAKDSAMRRPNQHNWIKAMASSLSGSIRPSRVWESIVDVWVEQVLDPQELTAWCRSVEDALTGIED